MQRKTWMMAGVGVMFMTTMMVPGTQAVMNNGPVDELLTCFGIGVTVEMPESFSPMVMLPGGSGVNAKADFEKTTMGLFQPKSTANMYYLSGYTDEAVSCAGGAVGTGPVEDVLRRLMECQESTHQTKCILDALSGG